MSENNSPSASNSVANVASGSSANGAPTSADAESHVVATGYLVIYGEMLNGGKFRPSDWGERLYSTLRALGEESDYYANYVHLVNFKNKKCIVVDKDLKDISPVLYNFYRRFAQDNRLSTDNITRQDWDAQYTAAG